jgi:hypothetical protein
MKKQTILMLIIAVLLLATSCATRRAYESVHVRDSLVISTFVRYHDTTIYQMVEVPNFTSHDSTVINYVNNTAYVSPLFLKGQYSTANVWIHNNVLQGELSEGGWISVAYRLKVAEKTTQILRDKMSTSVKVVKEYRTRPIVKFFAWMGLITLLLALLYIAWRIAKLYFGFSLNPVKKIIP